MLLEVLQMKQDLLLLWVFFIFKQESKTQMLSGPISTADMLKQKLSFQINDPLSEKSVKIECKSRAHNRNRLLKATDACTHLC